MTPATILGESRVTRVTLAVALLLVVTITARPEGAHRTLLDANGRANAFAVSAAIQKAARTERCPRPALREPTTGDGSLLIAAVVDPASREAQCLTAVAKLRMDLDRCTQHPCPTLALASLPSRPDLVDECAALYQTIADSAHATEACSPERADTYDVNDALSDKSMLGLLAIPLAVRLRIAPLVANGELRDAAHQITAAIRYVDDYGRAGVLIAAMIAKVSTGPLLDTLAEILADQRLTADEARAIARDLDILLATGPSFDSMMRQETAWVVALVEHEQQAMHPITNDLEQDRALSLLGIEYGLRTIERACKGKSLHHCVENLPAPPGDTYEEPDFEAELRSGLDDAEVRDRVVALIGNAQYGLFTPYARKLGEREFALVASRMQAELRTLTVDECGDPQRRRARLATWLVDGIELGDESEPAVRPAPWQIADRYPTTQRVLRCLAPHR